MGSHGISDLHKYSVLVTEKIINTTTECKLDDGELCAFDAIESISAQKVEHQQNTFLLFCGEAHKIYMSAVQQRQIVTSSHDHVCNASCVCVCVRRAHAGS